MDYRYKNFLFRNLDNKSVLYRDGLILFLGNSWSGILQFIQETDNAPEVKEMFRAQLEQREVLKFKQQRETLT